MVGKHLQFLEVALGSLVNCIVERREKEEKRKESVKQHGRANTRKSSNRRKTYAAPRMIHVLRASTVTLVEYSEYIHLND